MLAKAESPFQAERVHLLRDLRSALSLSLLVGCGARTGLAVPDADVKLDTSVPLDARVPDVPCVEVTREDPTALLELEIPASLRVVDVFFLIDSSGSMRDEIDSVRDRLRSVVLPGIRSLIPDAAYGVAIFGEFPREPHAGGFAVQPYELRTTVTTDVARVESALSGTPSWNNGDDPEAAIEGLYQVMTGEGLSPFIEPSLGCPSGGELGGCFRPDAFRIVVLITDAPMHNGPPDVPPFADYRFEPAPHSYAQTLDAVAAGNTFLIGLGARDPGRPDPLPHLRGLARDVGSLDGSGQPLVFDIGNRGEAIGDNIVSAVRRLAEDVPLDIEAVVRDRTGDDVDALDIVEGIVARRASPGDGVASIEGSTFLGVRPGTRLTFELEIDVSGLPGDVQAREYWAEVDFRVAGRSTIDRREVRIVIPGGEVQCEDQAID